MTQTSRARSSLVKQFHLTFYGEKVARRVRAVAPHARLVIVVRDPTDRLYSHYNMTVDPEGSAVVHRKRGHFHLYAGDAISKRVHERAPHRPRSMESLAEEDLGALEAAGVGARSRRRGATRLPSGGTLTVCLMTWPRRSPWVGRGLYAAQLKLSLRHFPANKFSSCAATKCAHLRDANRSSTGSLLICGLRTVSPTRQPRTRPSSGAMQGVEKAV